MTTMKLERTLSRSSGRPRLVALLGAMTIGSLVLFSTPTNAAPAEAKKPAAAPAVKQKVFATPQEAADALIAAAEKFDVEALKQILGKDGADLVMTEDPVQDKNQAAAFAARARAKSSVVTDPKHPGRATLVVGEEDWPSPIPIVKGKSGWRFDSKKGREEVLLRRIGGNELDAIQVCRGYVEAQQEYASTKHDGSKVNQYAQKIISTPGKQDGLAWRTADGKWEGPVGEHVAQFIAEGYTDRMKPFHGYYFKVLKGQGPAAHLGEMDFVVQGVMIGGFALAAAPAEYAVTGVKTFIVSHDGEVYEKDLGEKTLEEFAKMERFNPDKTWSPVEGD